MTQGRAAWWMYAAAAAFAAYFGLLAWCAFRGPAEPGIEASFGGATLAVKSVERGSPAEAAGLRVGDRVFAPGGRAIRNRFDWMALTGNWEAGKPAPLEMERGADRVRLELNLGASAWSGWGASAVLSAALLWGVRLATLATAMLIAFRRPHVPLALVGAWFLAAASVSLAVVPNGMAATWRGLPTLTGAPLWPPALSTLVLPAIFFTFFAMFPRNLLDRPWKAVVIWLPPAVAAGLLGNYLYRMVLYPEQAMGAVPDWFLPAYTATSLVYIAGGVAIQVRNWTRMEGQSERRRALILAVSAVIGWSAVTPIVILHWRSGASSFAPALFSSSASVAAAVLFLACLVLVSITLLRRRVFGFRLMVRQGLRYAMARRFLVLLAPALGAALALDLLGHRDEPLADILEARGWIYAALGGLAILAQSRREGWLEALDRRFFRERYDAQNLLREVVEVVHKAGEFAKVAPQVVARIETALHPEFAALMARDGVTLDFRSIAAAPAGQSPPPLPADSKLVSLVKVLGKPLELTLSTGWLRDQLPSRDTDFARQARIELLVPITAKVAEAEALLAMGPKRSEEPYTQEDRDLLVAIATSLALLLQRQPEGPHVVRDTGSFQECPRCGACYDSHCERCTKEGEPLARRPVPRVLVDRYRLERRIGGGGMGEVYEATDLALERRVAAKLIHENLVGSAEAAERFRREARAAASFSHPNIVTVHDFGVVAGTRGFLVMELLKGKSLRQELELRGPMPSKRAREVLRGVCDALEAAHHRQLVHRDLKPENIFLALGDSQETTKVLDFGVAKWLRPSTSAATQTMAATEAGVLVGTFQYMAPEQLLGEQPQPSWDLWALAVVAYEMLTGVNPFHSASRAAWREAVLAGRFAPVGPPWAEFFSRTLAPRPEFRPASAREILSEFESAAG